MTLGFKTSINGKDTYFVEKILAALLCEENFEGIPVLEGYDIDLGVLQSCHHKKHSIREDLPGRWKSGNKIHFVINNRTPRRLQFSPVVYVQSIQRIHIKWCSRFGDWQGDTLTFIDGVAVNAKVVEALALNDGFESAEEFFKYFNTDFEGVIIHWTKLKYPDSILN